MPYKEYAIKEQLSIIHLNLILVKPCAFRGQIQIILNKKIS